MYVQDNVTTYKILLLAVKCDPIVAPKDGTMFGPNCHGHYQATCFFNCNTGFLRYGPPNRSCLKNGKWSGTPVRCDGKIMKIERLIISSKKLFVGKPADRLKRL